MNNTTFNSAKGSSRLTKAGTWILIFSLVFSVVFIALGIVRLDIENEPSPGYTPNYGSSNKNTSITVTTYSKCSLSSYTGQTVELKFTPTSSGTYKFYVAGVTVYGVEDSQGNSKYYSDEYNDRSSTYDDCYSMYCDSYQTYTIEVYVGYSLPAVYFVYG